MSRALPKAITTALWRHQPAPAPSTCGECEAGIVDGTCGYCVGSGEGQYPDSTCQICKGSGEVYYECEACDGTGEMEEEE